MKANVALRVKVKKISYMLRCPSIFPGNIIDLAREIRRERRDLPVLLASGYSHVLAQTGTYDFELLRKPYSMEQLSRLLQKVTTSLRRKRLMRRNDRVSKTRESGRENGGSPIQAVRAKVERDRKIKQAQSRITAEKFKILKMSIDQRSKKAEKAERTELEKAGRLAGTFKNIFEKEDGPILDGKLVLQSGFRLGVYRYNGLSKRKQKRIERANVKRRKPIEVVTN